jgi:hypothetical protein
MTNWKTTVSGVLAIVVAAGNAAINMLNGQSVDYASVIAAIMAGIGLITAKDSNK